MKCPWSCGWQGTVVEYAEHYNSCPKKVCPRCNSTNIFFVRVDEIECLVCGHTWKKGEKSKIEEAQLGDEGETWLIRDKTFMETDGKVEEPLETPVKAPEAVEEEPEGANEP